MVHVYCQKMDSIHGTNKQPKNRSTLNNLTLMGLVNTEVVMIQQPHKSAVYTKTSAHGFTMSIFAVILETKSNIFLSIKLPFL